MSYRTRVQILDGVPCPNFLRVLNLTLGYDTWICVVSDTSYSSLSNIGTELGSRKMQNFILSYSKLFNFGLIKAKSNNLYPRALGYA